MDVVPDIQTILSDLEAALEETTGFRLRMSNVSEQNLAELSRGVIGNVADFPDSLALSGNCIPQALYYILAQTKEKRITDALVRQVDDTPLS